MNNKDDRFILGLIGLLVISGGITLFCNPSIATSIGAPLSSDQITLAKILSAVIIVGGLGLLLLAFNKKFRDWAKPPAAKKEETSEET